MKQSAAHSPLLHPRCISILSKERFRELREAFRIGFGIPAWSLTRMPSQVNGGVLQSFELLGVRVLQTNALEHTTPQKKLTSDEWELARPQYKLTTDECEATTPQ